MGGRPEGVRSSTPARLRTVAIRYLSGTVQPAQCAIVRLCCSSVRHVLHLSTTCCISVRHVLQLSTKCVAAQYDMLQLSTPQRSSCAAAIMQRAVAAPSLRALPRPSVSVASERSWQSQPLPICDHSGLLSARRLGVLCAAGAHSLEHSFYVSPAHLPHDVAQQHKVRLHARQSESASPDVLSAAPNAQSDAARSCLRQRVASRVDADGLEPPASADLGLLLGLRFLPPKQFDT